MVEESKFGSNSIKTNIRVVLDQINMNRLPIAELGSINQVIKGHLDALLRNDDEAIQHDEGQNGIQRLLNDQICTELLKKLRWHRDSIYKRRPQDEEDESTILSEDDESTPLSEEDERMR